MRIGVGGMGLVRFKSDFYRWKGRACCAGKSMVRSNSRALPVNSDIYHTYHTNLGAVN